jgi:hypothetical protein
MANVIALTFTPEELEALRELLNAYADGYLPAPSTELDDLHDYLNDV